MMKQAEFLNQKTIFVLVHTSDMLIPSGVEISLESKKSFTANPLIYNKTLWSAVCESVLEYIRIVYDIFGTEREMALIVVDSKEKICISTNDKNQQSWRSWMKVLSDVGSPQNATPSLHPNVLPAFNSIKSVLELKPDQDHPNAGRVIVLGYKMGENVAHWVDDISSSLAGDLVTGARQQVSASEWYFIDVEPALEGAQGDDLPVLASVSQSNSQHSVYRQTVMANRDLHRSLMALCEQQHQLACILVQNIPMKEDTNNTQSAMYGVELIHPRAALDHIVQAGLLPLMTMAHRPYCGFSSCIGIRWVTPKQTQDIEYYNTKSVYRITTADVCHRASCCLANFVLEGRSVVLEVDHGLVPNAPPGLPEPKYELLLLTSHSGLLHVHTLSAHRDPIFPAPEAPAAKMPHISELASKKIVNKLRVTDFSQFILSNRLVPAAPQSSFLPMDRAFREIEQHTRYWPELTSDTLVFNKPLMPKVAEILAKKHLDFSEKSNCIGFLQQMIFDQSNAEKTAKKTGPQDTKAFKTELELVLWLYQDRSPAHKEVLDSFEVFGNSLKGIVDIGTLLSGDDLHIPLHVGLPKLEQLLKDGGTKLKSITQSLDTGVTSTSAHIHKMNSNSVKTNFASRKQQRRPEQGTLTLREVLSLAAENVFYPKRKRFDGELLAVDNITELYPANLPPSSTVDPRKE